MPNNENNYQIRSEFTSFLRGFSEFRVTDSELVGYANVAIQHNPVQNTLVHFTRSSSQLARYSQQYLIEQLLQELEKDYIDPNELMCIGRMLKKYMYLLKQIQNDHSYYMVTPGMVAGLFIVLHLSQLFFPASTLLISGGLCADLYGLGFWLFSVWSFSQHEKILQKLENALIEKINFLKSFSVSMQLTPYYSRFFSILPSYDEVISVHHEHESATENTDPRQGRC